jgi:hypothetical protein
MMNFLPSILKEVVWLILMHQNTVFVVKTEIL